MNYLLTFSNLPKETITAFGTANSMNQVLQTFILHLCVCVYIYLYTTILLHHCSIPFPFGNPFIHAHSLPNSIVLSFTKFYYMPNIYVYIFFNTFLHQTPRKCVGEEMGRLETLKKHAVCFETEFSSNVRNYLHLSHQDD